MSGTGASLNDKIDLAPWGYAPGDHLVTCIDCNEVDPLDALHVMHRHSTRCATHALKGRQASLRLADAHYQPDPDQSLADEVYGLIRPYSDRMVRILFIGAILTGAAGIGALTFFHP